MSDTTITYVKAWQVWDSGGRPTVGAEVWFAAGAVRFASAPAGASRGTHEAVDLRDGGSELGGMGVAKAVAHVNGEIARALEGRNAGRQAELDDALIALDGTPNKSRLGGNAMIAVSMAALHATAGAQRMPLWRYLAQGADVALPLPEIQIFGGGAHAGRRVDIQDFMVMALAAGSFAEALSTTAEVYRAAGELMREAGRLQGVADEGGYWPAFESNEDALTMLTRAIERAGYTPGQDVGISLDIAASEFGREGRYRLGLEGRELAADGVAGMAMLVTQVATATAAATWMFIEWFKRGKPTAVGIATGAVAGLVAITPASGTAGPLGAILIGFASASICFIAATRIKAMFGYDDSLDVFGVHGVGGIVGAVLTGVCASAAFGGAGLAEGVTIGSQVFAQIKSIVVTILWSAVVSGVALFLIDKTIGLRASEEVETVGLDLAEHGEEGYHH
mgnify:CR=1 FL=1